MKRSKSDRIISHNRYDKNNQEQVIDMQNMDLYYDFSGQKFGYPLSLSINGFSRNIFSRQSSLEISYILKGSYEAVTADFSYVLNEKDMIVIAPYDIHMLHKKDPADVGIILTIHIDFSRMTDSMVGNLHTGFRTAVCTETKNRASYIQLRNKIGELASDLMTESHDLYHMNVIMMEILRIASSKESFSVDELPLDTNYHENYMKAIKYIDGHYKENLTLGEIAKQLSFSTSYTSKLMKRFTGIPFVKYLAYVRVRASLETLLEGRESIEKIAFDCGMPSSKAYTEAFRELYGIVPSAYRKQFQKNLKYSKGEETQEMILDEEQKRMLWHLVKDTQEILYENEQLSIRKEGDDLLLTIRKGRIQIDSTPEGGMVMRISKEK